MSDTKTPLPVHPLLEGTTPGPWTYALGSGLYEQRYVIDSEPGRAIACCAGFEPRNKANANLIAMAPTLAAENARLRAALEALVRHTTESHMCYPDCVENASKVLASLTT